MLSPDHWLTESASGGNSSNISLIKEMRKRGIHKGYAHFWNANINTYLSDGDVTVIPTLCGAYSKTVLYPWLISEKQMKQSANKSFFIVDPKYYKDGGTCQKADIIEQFGKPQEVIKIYGQYILIYNYDLRSDM